MEDGEFWSLTPAEFRAYQHSWRALDERQDRRAALIAWLIAESNRDPKKPPFKLDDFLLHKEPEPPPSPEHVARKIEMAMRLLGGTEATPTNG